MRGVILAMVAAAATAAEVEYVPVLWAPPAGFPPALRDIASRLPADTAAREPDLVTYTHEGSHFLCRGTPGHHGLYVGRGLRIYIPTPPLTTAEVFAAIPEDKRGTIYGTYLRQGQSAYWQAQPLMILDEWGAYLAGATARREMALDSRRETDVHCATMAGYAAVMYRMAKECSGYPHAELKGFCDWQLARCREVIPEWDELADARFD
jgi:hypothetical protein